MIEFTMQKYPVTSDSRAVAEGGTFIAVQGFKENGLNFITDALKNGAKHIVIPQGAGSCFLKKECETVGASLEEVADPRKELALRVAAAYGNPAKKVKIIGVTGTKGKTTTTHLIFHLLKTAGVPVALIGGVTCTIYTQDTCYEEKSVLTTPSAEYIHSFLARAVTAGVEVVVLELSAHAAALDRTYGLSFTAFGFTNLLSDHLDFFGTLETYFQAKCSFIDQVTEEGIVITLKKDLWHDRIAAYAQSYAHLLSKPIDKKQLYACEYKSHGRCMQLSTEHFAMQETPSQGIMLKNIEQVHSLLAEYGTIWCPALFGNFNGENILLAVALTDYYLRSYRTALSGAQRSNIITAGCRTFSGAPGRLQKHQLRSGAIAFVDHAHTGPSAEAVLKVLRSYTDDLIVVFGCGGDKDPARRAGMAQAVARYADKIIVTNDNPRTEDPDKIIAQILAHIPEEKMKHVHVIQNRAQAIAYAVSHTKKESSLVLLGKGHEEEQIVGSTHFFFSDYQELSRY